MEAERNRDPRVQDTVTSDSAPSILRLKAAGMMLQRGCFGLGFLALVTLPLTADMGEPSPSPAAAGLSEHPAHAPASCIAPPNDAVPLVQTPAAQSQALPRQDV